MACNFICYARRGGDKIKFCKIDFNCQMSFMSKMLRNWRRLASGPRIYHAGVCQGRVAVRWTTVKLKLAVVDDGRVADRSLRFKGCKVHSG